MKKRFSLFRVGLTLSVLVGLSLIVSDTIESVWRVPALNPSATAKETSVLLRGGQLEQEAPQETTIRRTKDLTLGQAFGRRSEEAESLARFARIKQREGDLERAAALAKQALGLLESQQSSRPDSFLDPSYLVSHKALSGLYIDILMGLEQKRPGGGYAEAAFIASERSRSLFLPSSLGKAKPAGLPEESKFREIQSHISDGETRLISYWLGEERSFAWIVSRDFVAARELPPAQQIDQLANQVYEGLGSSYRKIGKRSVEVFIDRLGKMIVAPIANSIVGAKRLVVIAGGSLQSIPFAALPDPSGRGGILLDRYEIVYLPSATLLTGLRREEALRPQPRRQLAIIADPVFSSDDPRLANAREPRESRASYKGSEKQTFARLPYSRQEAERISALWPEGQVMKAVDYSASLATVTKGSLSQYRLIHFATHGLLDDSHPEMSSVVLSLVDEKGRPEDGFLRSHEIENLSLSAELVVLSTCSTAVGRELRGEGLGALTRSFMGAGVPRVIASLWSVDDRATAELMSRFYGFFLDGLSPAAALREAQLSLRRDTQWHAPVYWAGFVLQGDWRQGESVPQIVEEPWRRKSPRRPNRRVARHKSTR